MAHVANDFSPEHMDDGNNLAPTSIVIKVSMIFSYKILRLCISLLRKDYICVSRILYQLNVMILN
jgi:hypothetical protein